MKYCVYSKITGVIRQTMETCQQEIDRQPLNGDEAIYVGDADPRLHRIDPQSGARVDFSERDGRVWDRTSGEWIVHAEAKRRRARNGRLKIRAAEDRQGRATRELLLSMRDLLVSHASIEALARLEAIESEIAQQRPAISDEAEST